MKKAHKNIILYITAFIIVNFISYRFRVLDKAYDNLKNRMYYDFEDFGISLEKLNDDIAKILTLDDYNLNKDDEFINRNIVTNFMSSNDDALDLGKEKYYNEDYIFMYLHVNDVIKNIVSDELITVSEEKYLKSLYNYNDEIITEYKNILGDIYYQGDSKKISKLKRRIIKIYDDYSIKAGELLNDSKYSFLKEYKGDFQELNTGEINFEKAKEYCEEVFSKLVKDRFLKYNNKSEENEDVYVFRTDLKPEHVDLHFIDDKPKYEVEFNKKTNKISVRAVSYTVPANGYKEDKLDNIAKDIIFKFDNNVYNYDKKINYDEKGKIHDITYSYIEKNNDVYDEMKKIQIVIEAHGLVSSFEIMYPYSEKIIMPTISKEEILRKIDKKAEIIDVSIIRNIEGITEYEVYLKYGDTLYTAVFDGEIGELKYYGRELRSYTLNK